MTKHRLVNVLHSIILILGMALLFGLCGWIVAGQQGLVGLILAAVVLLLMTPRASTKLVLRTIGARPIASQEAPDLHAALSELARRADLDFVPRLFYVPWPELTAFTIGKRQNPCIVVSAGLLRALDMRELIGVLAHEVAHVRHNDMWILGLADMVTRLTRFAATFGVLLLIVNLPLLAAGETAVSWFLILVLLLAPTASALLQLGLSRAREFSADLEAAELSGDPEGLARALNRLERGAWAVWEALLGYRAGDPTPSLLRSHPKTEQRIRRLLALTRRRAESAMQYPAQTPLPSRIVTSARRRRWPWFFTEWR